MFFTLGALSALFEVLHLFPHDQRNNAMYGNISIVLAIYVNMSIVITLYGNISMFM